MSQAENDRGNTNYEEDTQEITCVLLTEETKQVRRLISTFRTFGFQVKGFLAKSMKAARSCCVRNTIAFTVGYCPDPTVETSSLSPLFPLQSVRYPPLVLVVERDLTPEEHEHFRQMGVSYIFNNQDRGRAARDLEIFEKIANSPSWLNVDIASLSLSDVLQMMNRAGQSIMITVMRSPEHNLGELSWRASVGKEWFGRIYIYNGQVLHAQTPDAAGETAFAQMLALKRGKIVVHEAYLRPVEETMSGSIESNLLGTMVLIDETNRGLENVDAADLADSAPSFDYEESTPEAPPAPVQQPPAPVQQPPAPVQQPAGGQKLPGVIACHRSLKGVAVADKSGNLIDLKGQVDGETVCALASMGFDSVEQIGELLGLGDALSWGMIGQDHSIYVQMEGEKLFAATGEPENKLEAVLDKIDSVLKA